MNQASYNEFYNVEYRKLYGGNETATSDFFNAQRTKGERIYKFLQNNHLIKGKSLFVLEVGCGAGGILDTFKSKGHKVKGLDLGEEYIEYGKKNHNLELEVGILSDLNIDGIPDIIIYSHILEHILDLKAEFQAIKKIIDKDTIVYIEVPGIKQIHKNYESNILRYFQNAHIFHFTLETLNNLLGENGFELLHGNQFVQSAFKLTNKPYSIKSDYTDCKEYIIKTEKKRSLYPLTRISLKRKFERLVVRILEITRTRNFVKSVKQRLTMYNKS